jgi:hypothetical protein
VNRAAFDAERYLRELSGRTLADDGVGRMRGRTPLLAAVQALVAVGCVEEAAGQRVLDEHEAERRRRDPEVAIGWTREWPDAPIARRRVALGEEEVARSEREIRVRYVVFSPESTEVAVSIRRPRAARWAAVRRERSGNDMPCRLGVAADGGEPVPAGFSGAGSSAGWEGVLRCHPPLDGATRWIEIDGLRLPLADVGPRGEVRIEALPAADAARHLWHVVALSSSHPLREPYLEQAIDALAAAGVVSGEDPQLATMRAVASAVALDGRRRRRVAVELPEPFSSLWRPREFAGPVRTIAVGAVTPLFDGVAVAVDALESSVEGWSIRVEFAPEGASPFPFEAPTARSVRLVWWAVDDRGNRYLAEPGGLGGNARGGRGELRFDAPLHPQARWIELRPTTEASQAVVRVALD